jgi:hypothetical protein
MVESARFVELQVLHWTEVFTSKLDERVKMVGSMISCEGSPKDGNAAGEWRANPYVLPYAWATDKVGCARMEQVLAHCCGLSLIVHVVLSLW